ncbi:MAG TPA: AI-2E family transporter [Alphaproteobacteria bacterium]|nr:AI-2E family transporter [Alphaproteobacteria bacterium]
MAQRPEQRTAYIATAFALIFILLLCAVSFVIVRPFLAALLWGAILAIATWPVFSWFRRHLGGRGTLAATLMTLLLVLVLLGPVALVGVTMADNVATLGERLRLALQEGGVEPPDFLARIPLVGDRLVQRWRELAAEGSESEELQQLLRGAVQRLLKIGAAVGGGIAELALSIVCAFFFYRDGEAALHRLTDILSRVAGDRARRLLAVAYGTLKGVVYGVMGSALAQASLAAFGYWISGVPAPFLLGIATGFLGIIPGAAVIVWLPVAIWLFRSDQIAWGVFLVAWSAILVGNIDNVIRPMFISRGSALPLLLILIGILGGAIAFGFIGIFLGPTILAILYTLMREWSPGDYVLRPVADQQKPPAS